MKKKTKVGIGVASLVGSVAAVTGGIFFAKHNYEKEAKGSKKAQQVAFEYLSQEGPVSDIIVVTNEDHYIVNAKVKKGHRKYDKTVTLNKEFDVIG